MDRWVGKIVVVTGASAGIGLATTRALIKHGMIVVGLSRRKQKMLDEMTDLANARGKFHALECDVSKRDSIAEAFQWIKENLGTVQVLINNAGYIALGTFTDTTPETWQGVIDVNLMGSIHCATTAVKMMQEAKLEGHIININSIEGHRIYLCNGNPFNIYGVTKHGITAFTETLQRELMGQNIRSLSPGLVNTELLNEYGDGATLCEVPGLEPKDISDSIIYVLGTPQRVQVTELIIRPLGERAL
ncbi:farnesol dehydrogenase isoform X2 [Diachasma alloeum]|uniref:farnesol dehydrogenase isoform X2 n=1 Tax=Diachasma alloeum TaxID=454923 RepID=UPI0007382E01|nr:farnesol dehydrogenase isoform X2 [Diachasma alloeum]